ncbi:MAG: DUF5667 domain-containing protein, partial [Chloroflexi bacterium]|nr:DUF5667 domain-containing protein [Chloroflexota bacterium]
MDDCLARLAAGESIVECLARYPEHADELAPLLRTSQETIRIAHTATPSDVARARGMARMQAALAEGKQRSRWRWQFPGLSWRPLSTPILAAFAVVFLTVVAAGGTTVASADSLPGEALYPVKTMRESVEERIIARSAERKAEVQAKLARERGREMRELIVRGRIHEAEVVAFRLQRHLNESANHIGVVLPLHFIEMPPAPAHHKHKASVDALRHRLSNDEAYVKGQLTAVVKQVPEPHKQRVWRLIHQSDMGYKVIIIALANDGAGTISGYYGFFRVPVCMGLNPVVWHSRGGGNGIRHLVLLRVG